MTRPLQPENELAQNDFERSLFESARSDAPPPGATERAWRRFAADTAVLAPLAAAVSAPRGWFDGAAARAAKWTLIGAIGGGSLVAVWLRRAAPSEPALGPVPAALEAPATATHAAFAAPSLAGPPALLEPAPAASAPPALSASNTTRPRKPSTLPPVSRASKGSPAESLLAREVAALDAARTALAVGASASALRQIAQYHRDFPAGELSADADVVAIEALAAESDPAVTKRAARQFLRQHPRDPHVARIRELAR